MRTILSAPPLYRMPAATIQTRQQHLWKYIQAACWMLAIVELFLLWLLPQTGIMILWNILIPLAPAMLVLDTGLWRNVCPLGTSSLIADKLGLSGKKKLTVGQSTWLNLAGIVLLMLIIPLRHIWFNTGGRASAVLLAGTGALALFSGFLFERKSGWCSGACPVHPVEKLYGSGVAATSINAHCSLCIKCVTPCPDSTPNIGVRSLKGSAISSANEILMAGCFPGYVWGWFQVPDYTGSFEWHNLFDTYGYPAIGAIVSLTLFLLARQLFPKTRTQQVTRFFGALAISVYY